MGDTDKEKEELLSGNNNNENKAKTNIYTEYKEEDDDKDNRSSRFWDSLNYDIGILPNNTNVAVIKFRFTNGFFSSLIHFYKVIPTLVKYMHDKNIMNPIVIYTCNTSDLICTFYSPFENISQFHMNELDTKKYKLKLIQEKKILIQKKDDEKDIINTMEEEKEEETEKKTSSLKEEEDIDKK